MDFGVAPAPMPQAELDKGRQPISWLGGWVYAIPSTAQQQAGRLEVHQVDGLARRLPAAGEHAPGHRPQPGPALRAPAQPAQERQRSSTTSASSIGTPPLPPRSSPRPTTSSWTCCRGRYYRPVTPVGQLLWNEHRRAPSGPWPTTRSPQQALDRGTASSRPSSTASWRPRRARPCGGA